MSAILAVVTLLSLDATRVLVSRGHGLGYDTDAAAATSSGVGRFTATLNPATGMPWPALAITGATNATPIVITTAHPHGASTRGVGGLSCIISGITGNTAANNIDADPRSTTIGLPAGTLAVPTGPTTLALYGQDPATGALVALAGNGVYTGGGTLTPALTDGSILIGRDTIHEHSAPPRIVMVPRGVPEWGTRIGAIPNAARTADRRAQQSQRTIRSPLHAFDVHCWGQATPPDPARDYDIAFALAEAVNISAHLLTGTPEDQIGGGSWDDEKERATQQIKAGHLFVYSLALRSAMVDNALPFVPGNVVIVGTTQTQENLEQGCTG